VRLSHPVRSPYRLYLGYQFAMAIVLGMSQATTIVYWVTDGRLDPLLVALGAALMYGAEESWIAGELESGG
jgi:hypothetical protein